MHEPSPDKQDVGDPVQGVDCPLCIWCDAAMQGKDKVAVKVLAHFPAGADRAWEEVALEGAEWVLLVERLRGLARVHEVTILDSTPLRARVRLCVSQGPLTRAVAASGVIPRFPFEVKDGKCEWLVVAEREGAARFAKALRENGASVEIVSSHEYHHARPSVPSRRCPPGPSPPNPQMSRVGRA